MKAKQQANLMIAEFSLVVLAEMGHKIDMDKVTAIAKASVKLAIDKIIKVLNPQDFGLEMEIAFKQIDHWKEVKQYIDGKDQ